MTDKGLAAPQAMTDNGIDGGPGLVRRGPDRRQRRS
jgi:hypothetical protein